MKTELKSPARLDKKPNGFFEKYFYILMTFVCSAALMMIIFYCYSIVPFGGNTVLRMDLYHQYGPLFAEFYDRLTQFKSFLYSWNSGGGGAFLGNYYNYLSSPIGDLIALIAGHEHIPEAIGFMILVKNALAATTLAYYLKKVHGKNDFTITAFGILYAFCGFFIAYYWNVMWIDAMYLLPLIVLGIENIINKRSCKLYVIALAVSFFSNYYMSYMICIFSVLYFLVYFISHNRFKDSYADIPIYEDDNGELYSRGIHKFIYNKFLRSGFLFAASSIIAVMLVAFSIIPTYMCLKSCSATSGIFPSDAGYYNNIFDFLSNHLASLEPTIRSSGDTVLPNVYCGILTILLVPLYLFCDKISAKERAAHVILLAVFFVGFNLNYANYILHAFHFPNDLPFRFSFLYSFTLIIMAYRVLVHIRDISSKAVIGSGVGIVLFISVVQKLGMSNVSDTTVYLSIGFTAAYVIVLNLMRKKEYVQTAVALLLMCCVFAEAAFADIDHLGYTATKESFSNNYSDFRTLKNSLDEKEGNDKYRLELTKINTLMDASWFNYNGISVFSSMAYESSANFQNKLGVSGNYINSYIYYSQTPVYNAMMSLKYLVNNDSSKMNSQLFTFDSQCGKFAAYKNNYYLPIAYAVDKNIKTFDASSSSNPFEVQQDYWYYSTGYGGVFDTLALAGYETDNVVDLGDDFGTNAFTISKQETDAEATLTLHFTVENSQNVYLYLKCSDVDSVTVYNENGFSKNAEIGEPHIIDCGYCESGDVLTVEIPIGSDVDTARCEYYTAGLNNSVFNSGYQKLSQGAVSISDFTDTYIKGTVFADEDKVLYTSINYDAGWTVTVDGIKAETSKIGDALLAVDLPEGQHTVEFSYSPSGLTLGIGISSVTAFGLLVFLLLRFILRKKKKPQQVPVKSIATPVSEPTPAKTEESHESAAERRISRIKQHKVEEEDNTPPTGIDALMAEDLGKDVTVEQAEALLGEPDEYENSKPDTTPSINRADELLKTQKLDIKTILTEAKKAEEDINNTEDKK